MFVEENITTFQYCPWTGSPVLVLPDEQARTGAHQAVTVMSVFLNGGGTASDLPRITVLLFRLHPGHEEFPLN